MNMFFLHPRRTQPICIATRVTRTLVTPVGNRVTRTLLPPSGNQGYQNTIIPLWEPGSPEQQYPTLILVCVDQQP